MKKALFITFILIIIINSCNISNGNKYVYTIAYVDSTKKIHWGKGLFKQRVFYSFFIDTLKVKSVWDYRLVHAYSSKFGIGDSIFIRYKHDHPEQSEIIDVAYKKGKIKL